MPRISQKIGLKNRAKPMLSAREHLLKTVPLFKSVRETIGTNAHIVSVALNPGIKRNNAGLVVFRPSSETKLELNMRINGIGRQVKQGEFQVVGLVEYSLGEGKTRQLVLAVNPNLVQKPRSKK